MIQLKRAVLGLVVAVAAGALALPLISYAQGSPSEIVINYPELTDVDDALQLGIYFTVTDGTGRVVPDAQVQSARILIDDGTTPTATVEQPDTPFYIILVLDASGSMAGAAEDMRQAAIQAIKDAPDQARFAVLRFNERIDLLQEFTDDRNRAINAIGEVQPVNLAGTCLYDAAYEAVDTMKDAPPGRRAIILFTDGKDETAQGDVCSRHTLDDVVQYANSRDSRVPIHTIGLSTRQQNINAGELRNIASQTGGLSAIGEQETLSSLFGQIMDALKSQWLAKALIYPLRGPHTATLTVTLADGTTLQPGVVSFEVLRDYQVPVTPTFTPTPIVVNLEIQSVTVDFQQELVALEVSVRGEQVIREYRFDFFDARTNQLLDRQTIPAPLTSPVTISASKLSGDIRVELRAFDKNGDSLSWTVERDNITDKATYEFSYVRPTPTPPPATVTPIPIGVELNSISYSPDTDVMTLDLSLTGAEQMGGLRITVVDAQTNQLKAEYETEVAESVSISASGLEPLHDYNVQVIALSGTGQNLARSSPQKITYTPYLTPTPTPQPTVTHTPTPKPVKATIASIGIDDATNEIVIGILTEDQDRIASYELQIMDSQTGLVVGKYVHTPPPYDTIRVPLANVPPGQYAAILRSFGPGGTLLDEEAALNFAYQPPPTATPVPTATPSPTPTPTPAPGFTQRVSDTVRDNPALTLVIALVGFGLLVVLFLLVRPRKKQATGTGFLSAQTGFYQMPAVPGGPASPPDAAPAPGAGPQPTILQAGEDPEKTNVFPGAVPPVASLTINRSPAASRLGPTVYVAAVPFKVGRGSQSGTQLSLDEDASVSRNHATLTYEGGTFYLTDLGSSNGTLLDGVRLTPQVPQPLHNGSVITFGKGTEVTFRLSGPPAPGSTADDDPGKTDYVDLNALRK